MKLYTAPIDQEDQDVDGNLYVEALDTQYALLVEWSERNAGGLEDFTISDVCGRSIPISIRDIDDLIDALTQVREASVGYLNAVDGKEYVQV